MRMRLDADALAAGVLQGDRAALGRAITLVESTASAHRPQAEALLQRLTPRAGNARRVGVSGPPGVGKSTFLDAFGQRLCDLGHRVAVLAVDPTSVRTGGSILGDKTRMGGLAARDEAFIRPSPAGGQLGGVARATREAMVVLEAAGFDVVLVETVGVGQSEVAVARLVDTFLVLALAGAGDSLQGIKKGILELADVLAVTKADGDNLEPARRAARELHGALQLFRGASGEVPDVLPVSAVTGLGLDELRQRVWAHRDALEASGALAPKRADQARRWLREAVESEVLRRFWEGEGARDRFAAAAAGLVDGAHAPGAAVRAALGDGAE